MKYARLVLLTMFALCFGAFAAEAAPAVEAAVKSPDWLILLAHIAKDVLPILAIPVTFLIGWGVHKVAAKYHLDGIINTQSIVDDAVKKGVDYAEQWAANQIKAPIGSAKMSTAVAFADSILQNKNVQNYAADHLEKIAEGLVAQQNATTAPVPPPTTI